MIGRMKIKENIQSISITPYSALAEIYDQVMDHVDYGHWANYVYKLAALHGAEPRTVLEVSCGTGALSRELSLRKIRVLACDVSLAMVQKATRRGQGKARNVTYWCSDMRRIGLRIPADLVLSLYDSMNYLIQDVDWVQALLQMHEQLRPGGLFIFDISTLRNSIETFADYQHEENFSLGYYRRESYFDATTSLQYNHFDIILHQKPDALYTEVHKQRIRPLNEVVQLIAQTPFKFLANYADFTLRPGSEKADRVHFVLQKEDD
jgi:SAM-dependent methyltransferase